MEQRFGGAVLAIIEVMDLRRRQVLVAAAVFGLAGVGCGDSEPTGNGTTVEPTGTPAIYVGSVDTTDLRVGLVFESGNAALFFCGGPGSLASTKWFRGASEPERLSITKDGATANGTMTATTAKGTVRLASNGPELRWTASRVAANSPAGLYEYQGADGLGGVVVTNGDSAQGAFIAKNDTVPISQIIVFRPIALVGERFKVSVNAREIFVTRVHPR